MAEALLRRHLRRSGVRSQVRSTGRLAGGDVVSAHAVTVMAERGLDIAGRRSVTTSASLVGGADIIITMSCAHVTEVVDVDSSAWPKTFALRALVRRCHEVGNRGPAEPLTEWVGRLHQGRRPADLLGVRADDDIADPYGMSLDRYRATADDLDALLARFVSAAYPAPPPGSGRGRR